MTVTVFGASGNVGRIVVNKLLARGDNVVAFVHRSLNIPDHPNLRIVQGDVHIASDVAAAIKGSDAVISTLGSWGTPTKDIVTAATRNIIPSMEKQGINRLVTLTGTVARASADKPPLDDKIMHALFGTIARKIQLDGEAHLKLLESSQLDWTTLRSPAMRGRGTVKGSKLSMRPPLPWITVHREEVADAMLEQLENTSFYAKAPYIFSKG